MGYSNSKNAFLKVEPLLAILAKTSDEKLFIPSEYPRQTVYAIRDGLHYAEQNKVEPYSNLKEKFIIKETRTGIEVSLRRKIHYATPIAQLADSQNLVLDKVTSLLEIIGAVIHHKAPRFEFPQANIAGDLVGRLEKWAQVNNYRVIFTPHIILERIDAAQDGGVE